MRLGKILMLVLLFLEAVLILYKLFIGLSFTWPQLISFLVLSTWFALIVEKIGKWNSK